MDAKPVEAYVEGVNLSVLLDPKLFGILSRRLSGIRAVAVTLMHETSGQDVHGEPNLDTITIWYPKRPRPGEPEGPISVDTNSAADLEATLASIEEFLPKSA